MCFWEAGQAWYEVEKVLRAVQGWRKNLQSLLCSDLTFGVEYIHYIAAVQASRVDEIKLISALSHWLHLTLGGSDNVIFPPSPHRCRPSCFGGMPAPSFYWSVMLKDSSEFFVTCWIWQCENIINILNWDIEQPWSSGCLVNENILAETTANSSAACARLCHLVQGLLHHRHWQNF